LDQLSVEDKIKIANPSISLRTRGRFFGRIIEMEKETKKNLVLRESSVRSLIKSLIYRVLAIIGTSILSWIITRDVKETISITIAIQSFLVILYYFNERIWNKIDWGREIKEK